MNSKLFDFFATDWLVEMANHFTNESALSKEQEKNSGPPSQ